MTAPASPRHLLVAVTMSVVAAGLLACGPDESDDLDEVRAIVEEQRASHEALDDRLSALEEVLGDDDPTDPGPALDALDARLTEAQQEIETLAASLADERSARLAFGEALNDVESDLRGSLADLRDLIEELRGLIDDLEVRYEVLQTRVDRMQQ